MPDDLPPCVGERLRDVLADIRFSAYEAAWERAHPPQDEDRHHGQEKDHPRQG